MGGPWLHALDGLSEPQRNFISNEILYGIWTNIFVEEEHVLGLHLDIRMGRANSLINELSQNPILKKMFFYSRQIPYMQLYIKSYIYGLTILT